MPKNTSTSVAARNLAILRVVILKIGELEQLGGGSKGLSTQGQADLSYVFPRSSMLAATNHAASVARLEHDEKVRSRGVYHLFRLPTYWEGLIHKASTEGFTTDEITAAGSVETAVSLFSELPELPLPSPSPQGPVDLGEIHLTSPRDLAILAGQYLAALRAKQYVIPYFRLADA